MSILSRWFKRQINIIIYDLIHCKLRNARVSKYNFKRRHALTAFIFRDVVVSPIVSEPLCHFLLRQAKCLTNL